MSTRNLDQEALRSVISICEEPKRYFRGTTVAAVSFIEGFLLGKCVYRFTERLRQALFVPRNVDVWPVIRNQVKDPLELIRSVAERLLIEDDYCICCGNTITDGDAYEIVNRDCISRVPGYGIRFVHADCCVVSTWPNNWAVCCKCGDKVDRKELTDAVENLQANIELPGSGDFGTCCFTIASIDMNVYWENLEAIVAKQGPIVDRYRALRELHKQINSSTAAEFPEVPAMIRRAFLPSHMSCVARGRSN